MQNTGEFRRGWPVLAAASVGIGLGMSPLPFYTIGVFIPPLLAEFGPQGWDVGFIINALAVYTFGSMAAAPVIGIIAEKFGARRVALISIVTFSLSLMAISLNTGSKSLYIFLWLVLAISGVGTLPITFTRPVANWFKTNRGIALGIALITTGVFGALAKYFAQFMVQHSDWRLAYMAVGCLPLVISLPLSLVALRDVEDVPAAEASTTRFKIPILMVSFIGALGFTGIVVTQVLESISRNGVRFEYVLPFAYLPLVFLPVIGMLFFRVGTKPPVVQKHENGDAIILPGMTLGEALRNWRFWLLALCFVPISYAVGAIIPNIEQVLTQSGMGMDEAVGLATLTGLAVLAGRVIGGYLIDRFWAPAVAFCFLASPAFALWLLGHPDVNANTATIAILMIGFGAGVEYDFMAYMVSKYFGMRSYSAIYGSIYSFFGMGAGLGPGIMTNLANGSGIKIIEWETGLLMGKTWEYTLTSAAIILFISTVPLLFLGRYKYSEETDLGDALAEAEETVETAHA
ncbi:MAG: MFS transporter [Hyphomonas sp.]|nr:MFS transporter [Hyphomonas sp.]